jgi:superfamily II DNA/RNA helicase
MTAEGHKVASLHGAKDASERDAIIDGFREGREKVLITTNVIARGIDILQVNMVVNYDLPLLNERDNIRGKDDQQPDIETYIHRIGKSRVLLRRVYSDPENCSETSPTQGGQAASDARASPSTSSTTRGRGCRWNTSNRRLERRSRALRRMTWTRWKR